MHQLRSTYAACRTCLIHTGAVFFTMHCSTAVRARSAEIGLADFGAIGELGRRPGSDHSTLR
jgi:hypothetical protein